MLIQYTATRECDLRATPPREWPVEANRLAQIILASSYARSKMAAELFPVEWLIARIEDEALRAQQVTRDFMSAARGDL